MFTALILPFHQMFRLVGLFLHNSKWTFQLKSLTKKDPCQWLATGTKSLCHLTPLPTLFATNMRFTHIQTESNPQPQFMSSVPKTHSEETWDFGWLPQEVYQWNLVYLVSFLFQDFNSLEFDVHYDIKYPTFRKLIKAGVVYFDQRLGAAQSK